MVLPIQVCVEVQKKLTGRVICARGIRIGYQVGRTPSPAKQGAEQETGTYYNAASSKPTTSTNSQCPEKACFYVYKPAADFTEVNTLHACP